MLIRKLNKLLTICDLLWRIGRYIHARDKPDKNLTRDVDKNDEICFRRCDVNTRLIGSTLICNN